MRKFISLFMVCLLVFTLASCNKENTPPKEISFDNIDYEIVAEIRLTNVHNGQETSIKDAGDISAICEFLHDVKGKSGISGKGYSEGSYSLSLYDSAGREVLTLGFGDSDAFFHGDYGDGYPVRYELTDLKIKDVISFLGRYDKNVLDGEKIPEVVPRDFAIHFEA